MNLKQNSQHVKGMQTEEVLLYGKAYLIPFSFALKQMMLVISNYFNLQLSQCIFLH